MPGKTGNTNALKHGLYAKRFTDAERKDLTKMPPDDLRAEIAMLRVITDRILAALETATSDAEATAKLTNSLTNAVATIGSTIRTHAILNGDYNPLNDALIEALTRVPAYETKENEQ